MKMTQAQRELAGYPDVGEGKCWKNVLAGRKALPSQYSPGCCEEVEQTRSQLACPLTEL